MEKSSRNILRRCRQKIVDDLDVTDVLDHLLANEVVNEEQMEEIFSRPTRVARARCLLDVLVKRGPNLLQFFPVINLLTLGPKAFPVFLDSLRDNYSWLVEFMVENHAVDGGQKTVVRFQSKDFLSSTDSKLLQEAVQLAELLVQGGVPHPPSTTISR